MPSWDGVQGAALLKNLLGSTDLRHCGAEMFEQLLGDLARDTPHGHEGLGRRLRKILRAVKARVDQRLRACPPDAFHADEFPGCTPSPRSRQFRASCGFPLRR